MKHTPASLKEDGRKFWAEFQQDIEPETASEFSLLETVCSLCDDINGCRQALNRDGGYVWDGSKLLAHPALKDLQRFTALFLKGLRDLRVKGPLGRPQKMPKDYRKGSGKL